MVEKYDLYRWDGFDESQDNVLDGEGFRLEISFTDGASIRANGNNAFPEDYFSAIGEIQEILDSIQVEKKTEKPMNTIQEFFAGFFQGTN